MSSEYDELIGRESNTETGKQSKKILTIFYIFSDKM